MVLVELHPILILLLSGSGVALGIAMIFNKRKSIEQSQKTSKSQQ